jgi:hypothetical protein
MNPSGFLVGTGSRIWSELPETRVGDCLSRSLGVNRLVWEERGV